MPTPRLILVFSANPLEAEAEIDGDAVVVLVGDGVDTVREDPGETEELAVLEETPEFEEVLVDDAELEEVMTIDAAEANAARSELCHHTGTPSPRIVYGPVPIVVVLRLPRKKELLINVGVIYFNDKSDTVDSHI